MKRKELDYVTLASFELETVDTHLYGTAPTAGRDDRVGYIFRVDLPSGELVYVLYDECYYHYECTRNDRGYNFIPIGDEYFILVGSDTTDFYYQLFTSYEEVKEYLYSLEDSLGYVLKF